jgi:competence protein ComEA
MGTSRNKLIFLSSLVAVFGVTLVYGSGHGYGSNLSAILGISVQSDTFNTTMSPKMSPGDMVTPKVTVTKVVTPKIVTTVTTMSPVLSPSIYSVSSNTSPSSLTSAGQPAVVSPSSSHVPAVTPILSHGPAVSGTPTTTSITTPSPIASTPPPTPAPIPPQSTKININTADLGGLDSIIGVGPVIAQRIIDYRTANGPFQKIEDIIEVKGIGATTFQKMKDQITVGP